MPRTTRTALTVPAAVTALANEREAGRRPGEPGAAARALMAGDADRDDRAAHLYAALVRAGVVGRFVTAPQTVRVPRQRGAVLALIAEGYSNSEIADALSLSLQTVKGHTRNLMDSFGVATRVEVVIEATRQGILPALPAPRTRR